MSQDQWGHDGYKKDTMATSRPLSGRRSRGRGRKETDNRSQHDNRLDHAEPTPGHEQDRYTRKPRPANDDSAMLQPQAKKRDTAGLRSRRPDAQVYVPRSRRAVVHDRNVPETVVGRRSRERDQDGGPNQYKDQTDIRKEQSEHDLDKLEQECQEVGLGGECAATSLDSFRATGVPHDKVHISQDGSDCKSNRRGIKDPALTKSHSASGALDEEYKKKHKKRKKRNSSHSKDRKVRDHSKERKVRDHSSEDKREKPHKSKHKVESDNLVNEALPSKVETISVANAKVNEKTECFKPDASAQAKSAPPVEGQFDDLMEYCYTLDDDEIEESRNLGSSSSIIIHSQEDLSTVGLVKKEYKLSGGANQVSLKTDLNCHVDSCDVSPHVNMHQVLKQPEHHPPSENDTLKAMDGNIAIFSEHRGETNSGDTLGSSLQDTVSNPDIEAATMDQELASSNISGPDLSGIREGEQCSEFSAQTVQVKLSDDNQEMPASIESSDGRALNSISTSEQRETWDERNTGAETEFALPGSDIQEIMEVEKAQPSTSETCENIIAEKSLEEENEVVQPMEPDDSRPSAGNESIEDVIIPEPNLSITDQPSTSETCENIIAEKSLEEENEVVKLIEPDDSGLSTRKEIIEDVIIHEPDLTMADQQTSDVGRVVNELCQNSKDKSQSKDQSGTPAVMGPDHLATNIQCDMEMTNSAFELPKMYDAIEADIKENSNVPKNSSSEKSPRPDTIIGAELPLEGSKSKPDNNLSQSEPAADGEDPNEVEEDSWDQLFNDDGEALDPDLMEELTVAVGKVSVQKTQFDYYSFQPKEPDLNYEEYNHLIEIYDFPGEFVTRDLIMAFSEFMKKGFDIKWVDDTHAIGVFESVIAANSALKTGHPLLKIRPISEATKATKLKAKKCTEFLQPYKARPETSAAVARNLVAGALGLRSAVPRQKQIEERKKLREAREKKKDATRQKKDAWEGIIGKCAMDEEG